MAEMTEEQARELQEKLKQMSPEELREFQKKQCVFCHIISGKVQSRKVYEDDKVLAVLDINPANPGHILLMPKEHYTIMPQMPDSEIEHIFGISKSLSNAVLRAVEAQGTNIIIANGVAAGQKAQHFMLHIIPRKENDGIEFALPQKSIADDELNAIADKLSSSLAKLTGAKTVAERKPEPKIFVMPKMQEDKIAVKTDQIVEMDKEIKKSKKKKIKKLIDEKSSYEKEMDEKESTKQAEIKSKEIDQEKEQADEDKSKANLDDIARLFKND